MSISQERGPHENLSGFILGRVASDTEMLRNRERVAAKAAAKAKPRPRR